MLLNAIEKAQKSETFCMFPWIHMYVGAAGDVKPCCLSNWKHDIGNFKKNTLAEIWNGKIDFNEPQPNRELTGLNEIRLKMLNGEKLPGCEGCYYREKHQQSSRRLEINEVEFKKNKKIIESTQSDGTLSEFKIKYFDIRFNNLCNFKCRSCSEGFSTLWHNDNVKLSRLHPTFPPFTERKNALIYPGQNENQALEEILPHLEWANTIYFAGGEPLIQKEHYTVLDRLLELNKNNVSITYNTNFSKLNYLDKNVLDYWNKFKDVNLQVSLDGIEERLEYWRKGANWKDILKNRALLKEHCPHVKFKIVFTVSWPNLMHMVDVHKYLITNNLLDANEDTFYTNIVDGPFGFQIWNIPQFKKDIIRNILTDYISQLNNNFNHPPVVAQIKNCLSLMDSAVENESETEQFLTKMQQLDELRGENFFNIFPEHMDMIGHFYSVNKKYRKY